MARTGTWPTYTKAHNDVIAAWRRGDFLYRSDVEAEFDILRYVINGILGGGDGVIALADTGLDSLKVEPTDPVSLKVKILAGVGYYDTTPFRASSSSLSAQLSPPATYQRVDLVSIDPATSLVTVTTGIESEALPVPSTPTGHLALAKIIWRVGATSIKATDDATNAYIVDQRTFVNG